MIRPNIKFFTNRLLILCIISLPIVTSCDYFRAPEDCSKFFESRPDSLSGFSLCSGGLATHGKNTIDWARCPAGTQFKASKTCSGTPLTLTFQEAQAYAKELSNKSGQSIRLPTSREMASITEKACINPAINLNVFPSADVDNYWTSEENSSRTRVACAYYTYQGRRSCLEPKDLPHPFMLVLDRDRNLF